jgi:hypothetical protein
MSTLMTRLSVTRLIGPMAVGLCLVVSQAAAQERPGRYVMQPTDGGIIRMDGDTGEMSFCKKVGDKLACEPFGDQAKPASSAELDKLRIENAELRATVKHLEEMLGVGDKGAATKKAQGPAPGLGLPSEKEVDRALEYVERMYKKFRDKLKQLESAPPEKGTPL